MIWQVSYYPIEALGSEVVLAPVDVTDEEALRRLIAEIRGRFGAIHGVIHAAGTLDDGLIQLKDAESAHRVLAPKVQGTLALDNALGGLALDFFVLFSSVSNYIAPVGQVDYIAANSFLNAFAAAHSGDRRRRVVAVNWGKWRGLGMGSLPSPTAHAAQHGDSTTRHPLLGSASFSGAGLMTYRTRLAADELWLLKEHRLRDRDTLFPGTGYVELAAAAMIERFGPGAVEIRSLSFLAPLRVPPGQVKTGEFRFALRDGFYRFSGFLCDQEYGNAPTTHCAEGAVRHLGALEVPTIDLQEWFSGCAGGTVNFGSEALNFKQARHIDFGPRWRCLKTVQLGDGEAVSSLELPCEFESDLDAYRFHPALLDAAAGAAMFAIPDYNLTDDLYVPVSYGRIVLYAPLSGKCHCHIRGRSSNHARNEAVTFDWVVADERGRVIASAEDFVLRRLGGAAVLSLEQHAKAGAAGMELDPAAALEAFGAILRNPTPSEIVVCPAGLVFEETPTSPRRAEESVISARGRKIDAPQDSLERTLAGWWEEMLGVEGIGSHDDFFDLGGHSLLGVRLLTRIEREWKQSVPLHVLFEARTIEMLAAYLREGASQKVQTIVPINSSGNGPVFYSVHSLGGDAASFRHLARALGSEYNFCGIQKSPESGSAFSIESLADVYVKDLLAADPNGPYILGGWSAGSTIALEMAQQLSTLGKKVELVVALDGAPFNTRSGTPQWSPAYYWKLLRNFPHWVADDLLFDFSGRRLLRRAASKFMASGKRVGGVLRGSSPPTSDVSGFLDTTDYSEQQIDFMNALFTALLRYIPSPYAGKVLVYQARTEPLHHLFEVDRAWRTVAAQVEVVRVPGTHVSLIQEPNVRVIANDLRPRLGLGGIADRELARADAY